MELTQEQKVAFYEDGYVTLEGVIPQAMINAARQAINHEIGKGVRNGFPDINTTSVIADLFNETPAFSLVESALGKGNLQRLGAGTVQLNYTAPVGTQRKEPELATAGPPLRTGGHLDGIAQARDFLRGTISESAYHRNFTAFAVMYLNDVPEPYSGNFTIWPKSHHVMEAVLKEQGHEVLLKYMPDVDVPEGPVQITGKPGDLILGHHALIHTAAQNISANIRYALICRPRHVDIDTVGLDALIDIWREWDGIREAMAEAV
jgi:hypothetical protein